MAQGLIADEAHINERMGKLHGQSDTRDLERIPYQKGCWVPPRETRPNLVASVRWLSLR